MDKPKKPNNLIYKFILGIAGLVVLCGLSFYGGVHYQKGKTTNSGAIQTATAGGQGGLGSGFRGRFGGQRPDFGSVTAISSTSITIQSSQDNSSKSFTIDSSTTVTNGGQAASVSDIQTGDNVIIRTSSSGSTTASQILLNPSFGPGADGSSGGSSSD